jgi:hypothetical protein
MKKKPSYYIKPLEWEPISVSVKRDVWAKTSFGYYVVCQVLDKAFRYSFPGAVNPEEYKFSPSLEEAKMHCEQHWATLLLPMLVEAK